MTPQPPLARPGRRCGRRGALWIPLPTATALRGHHERADQELQGQGLHCGLVGGKGGSSSQLTGTGLRSTMHAINVPSGKPYSTACIAACMYHRHVQKLHATTSCLNRCTAAAVKQAVPSRNELVEKVALPCLTLVPSPDDPSVCGSCCRCAVEAVKLPLLAFIDAPRDCLEPLSAHRSALADCACTLICVRRSSSKRDASARRT